MPGITDQRPARLVTLEEFEAVTHRLETIFGQYRSDVKEAYRLAHQRHVEGESNNALRAFARLLLGAAFTLHTCQVVDWLQEQRANQGCLPSAEETVLAKAVPVVCAYQHQLTVFIDRYRSALDRSVLTDWLIAFSGHHRDVPALVRRHWVCRCMAGAVGEVIGVGLLRPLVNGQLLHGTVKQDRRGEDFRFPRTRRGVKAADIKSGRSCLEQLVVRRGRRIVLSIQSADIDGFYLRPEAELKYIKALGRVL